MNDEFSFFLDTVSKAKSAQEPKQKEKKKMKKENQH